MKKMLAILTVMTALGAGGAWANGPFPTAMTDGTFGPVGSVTPNSNTNEFEIYNAVNLLLGSTYTNNAQVDYLEYTGNTGTWSQTGNGGFAVIGLGAGATNTLEVYNATTPATLINPIGTGFTGNGAVGNGTVGSPYIGTGAIFPSGTNYGFVLNQSFESVTKNWYSNPTLNSDAMDHMLAYNLPTLAGTQVYVFDPNTSVEMQVKLNNPYLLAFEDNPLSPTGDASRPDDKDYNDLMFIVDGVAPNTTAPVPEPITLALFAVGLMAMAGVAANRKFSFGG